MSHYRCIMALTFASALPTKLKQMKQARPKLKPTLTNSDLLIELLTLIILICLIGHIYITYDAIPESVPTHFNAYGEPDKFGTKDNMLILPAIAFVLYIGLSILNRYPHIYNYPTTITKDNALKAYTNATKMMRIAKLITVIIFSIISFQTVETAKGQSSGLGLWFLPVTFIIILAPVFYYLSKSFKFK